MKKVKMILLASAALLVTLALPARVPEEKYPYGSSADESIVPAPYVTPLEIAEPDETPGYDPDENKQGGEVVSPPNVL